MKPFAAVAFVLLSTLACAKGRTVKEGLPKCNESLDGVVYTLNGKDKEGVWKLSCVCSQRGKGRFVWVNAESKKTGTEVLCVS